MIIDKLEEILSKSDNYYQIDDNQIYYKDILQKAKNLSNYLNTSPVVIYGHKEIDMIISIVSCIMSKTTYVPIDISIPKDRIKKIIEDVNAKLIIVNNNEKLKINAIKKIQEIQALKDTMTYNNNNSEYAYIIYTSGTTGNPKGIPITRKNLNNFINWISNIVLKDYKGCNVLNQANFNFDLSVVDIYFSLFNNCNLYAYSNYDFNISDFILKNNINLAIMTPTFVKLCLLEEKFNEKNIPNLKCIYFCGEFLDKNVVKKLWEKFPNLKIINAYGPTEATSAVSTVNVTKDMLNYEVLPIGEKNTNATTIEIIDDEIVLSGNSVFPGYLNDKKISKFYTNDLGYYYKNYLFIKGRKDNQIKYKGYRIELYDIENNILNIDGVKEAVVVPIRNFNEVKMLKAYVVSDKLKEEDIKKILKEKIPSYMIPKKIIIIEKIPINNNGKYDRKKLENYDRC